MAAPPLVPAPSTERTPFNGLFQPFLITGTNHESPIGSNETRSQQFSPTSLQESIPVYPRSPAPPWESCQPPVGHTFQALIQVLQHHSDDLHDGQKEGAKGQGACVIPVSRGGGQRPGQASSTPSHPQPPAHLGPHLSARPKAEKSGKAGKSSGLFMAQ